MDRETLVAAVNALEVPCKNEADKLHSLIKEKLNETLVEAGIDKIAKLRYDYGDSAEVEVEIPGKTYGHRMNIYFHREWFKDCKKRKVTLNVGTFGSFDSTMEPEVNFYIVAGALAKNLSKLQEKFDAIDFGPYETAKWNFGKACNELEKFDSDVKNEELNKKIAGIESKFIVGAKIRIGKNYKDEPIYDEIAKVTNKLIWLKNGYGRQIKKTEAVDKILKKYWEFA